MQRVIDAFAEHFDHIVDTSIDRLIELGASMYATMPREQSRALIAASIIPFQKDLNEGTTTTFPGFWRELGPKRAEQGAVMDVLHGTYIIITTITHHFKTVVFPDDTEAVAWWLERMYTIIFPAMQELVRSYVHARDKVVYAQASQIRTLSSPIIPIHNSILVLPLVGTIDSTRAGQIMEALLEGISTHQADEVIIDITGVSTVDSDVANYLLQAARAACLLGSHVILSGISPHIAQTMVYLDVDMSDMMTCANLQASISYALGRQGLAITPIATRQSLGQQNHGSIIGEL